MKKLMIALTMLLTITVSANAMSYEQARNEALFLTDKMAYELNLTDDQYEAAYEVNLDYLMSIGGYDDLYGTYWERRNMDLSYILYDWQYNMYCGANYFYRPLYWDGGYWHFGIYSRYPHRNYYYFDRPRFYSEYCGGHSWMRNGGRSFYRGRDFDGGVGMREGMGQNRFGGSRYERGSSTRTTVDRGMNGGSFGNGNRGSNSAYSRGGGSFGNGSNGNSGSFGGGRNGSFSRSGGTFGDNSSSNRSFSGSSTGSFSRGSGSMGGETRSMSPSSTSRFGGSSSSSTFGSFRGSFGGGSSNSSSSARSSNSGTFGGGSRGSFGGSFGGGSSSTRSSGGSFSGGSNGGGGSSSGGSHGNFGGHR